MAKRKPKSKSADQLGTENELMKLKMMAEFGGDFVANEEIPAEIENIFLKQIMQFHKKHDPNKKTTVYKFIGSPKFTPEKDIAHQKNVIHELNRLMGIMLLRGIELSALMDTPPRELLRFVTTELFNHEIQDMKMKGWTTHFIYEEFHPHPHQQIKGAAQASVQTIFNSGAQLFDDNYTENMKSKIGLSSDAEELREQILAFQSKYEAVRLTALKIPEVTINEDNNTAYALCHVKFQVKLEKGGRYKNMKTEVEFNLRQHPEMKTWWLVEQVICDLL